MRRITERRPILDGIAGATGVPLSHVERVVSAVRDAVDRLFLDGYSIVAPPFILAYPDDPVAARFEERLDGATDEDIDAWYVGEYEAVARWLGLNEDEYLRHPVASEATVMVSVIDALGLTNDDGREEAYEIARAWFDTFEQPRFYRFSSVGLESDLERWLIHHPEHLVELGYPVRLRHQQLVLPDRRRPDLVFDLVEDDAVTGTLIVELKAVPGYVEAVDQLTGYLDAFTALGLADGDLRGLLIADGFSPDVLAYADERGIQTATLSAIGYRSAAVDAGLTAGSKDDHPDPTDESGTAMSQTYAIFHGMDRETPRGTVAFGDDGKFVSTSDESLFASIFPDHLRTMTVEDVAGVLKAYVFVPVEQDDPTNADESSSTNGTDPQFGDLAHEFGAAVCSAGRMVEQVHHSVAALRGCWPGVMPPTPTALGTVVARVREGMPEQFLQDPSLPEHLGIAGETLDDLMRYLMNGDAALLSDDPEQFLRDARATFESIARRLGDILRRVS